MTTFLGPLELVDGRWVIGDPSGGKGSYLVLTAEGMEYYKPGTKGPEVVVPWGRFVNLGVSATTRAWMTTRGLGALSGEGVTMGPDGCAVEAFLRHPYEDWTAFYTHHERTYTNPHVFLVDELFRKTVEAKAAHRLGDPG